MATGHSVKIEGLQVVTATVEGNPDVFSSSFLVFVKPRWIADSEVSSCQICNQKFNQIRRRHHCRQCGHILCGKCCKDKAQLPQFGTNEAERVCDFCKPIAELLAKGYSSAASDRKDCVYGLTGYLQDHHGIRQLLQLGGVHMLVFLSKENNETIRGEMVAGLKQLITYPQLHPFLVEVGAAKALCRTASDLDNREHSLLIDCLTVLTAMTKTEDVRKCVPSDSLLQMLLPLTSSSSDTIALLALNMLSDLATETKIQAWLIDKEKNSLQKIFSFVSSRDEKIQEISLKILANISLGENRFKSSILQADMFSGNMLRTVLASRPKNLQVLCNAACLAANLVSCETIRPALKEIIQPLGSVTEGFNAHTETMEHVSRAFANFSKKGTDCSEELVPYIPMCIRYFLKSTHIKIQYQGARFIINMMVLNPQATTEHLQRDGIMELMKCLTSHSDLLDTLQQSFLKVAPEMSQPQ